VKGVVTCEAAAVVKGGLDRDEKIPVLLCGLRDG
jgi:hypothetical protein